LLNGLFNLVNSLCSQPFRPLPPNTILNESMKMTHTSLYTATLRDSLCPLLIVPVTIPHFETSTVYYVKGRLGSHLVPSSNIPGDRILSCSLTLTRIYEAISSLFRQYSKMGLLASPHLKCAPACGIFLYIVQPPI
jgi:hypothetical protein